MSLRKSIVVIMVACLATLFCNGCGTTNTDKNQTHQAISVENYNFNGQRHQVQFSTVPKKAVVYGRNAIDTIYALGAQDCIKIAVLPSIKDKEKYAKLLPKAEMYNGTLGQEAILGLQPDFVLAPRRYFGEKAMGDTSFWIQNKIPAYIQDASGPIPSLGNFTPCSIESEKTFISNMGKIFGQEEKAKTAVADIDKALKIASTNSKPKVKVAVIEFINGTIEVFGQKLLSGDIVTKLGGEIYDVNAPFISEETLMLADIDVIFLVHHGGEGEKEVALKHLMQKKYASLKAVKSGKVYTLHYDNIVATGIHTIETIKIIKNGMEIKK